MSILINPYDGNVKFKNYSNLDQQIKTHYDKVFDTVVMDYEISPRYIYETGLKIAFRDIFYYIDMLYDNNPENIIDVGCGECMWKNWFPRIIGFDPNINEYSQQDFVDYFDKDFSSGHTNSYHNGMALNSIHFISWHDINKQIDLAMNIVKERFLFTFNFVVMNDVPNVPMEQQILEFHSVLTKLPYKIIMFDAPLLRGIPEKKVRGWAFINGTVRFMLEK